MRNLRWVQRVALHSQKTPGFLLQRDWLGAMVVPREVGGEL